MDEILICPPDTTKIEFISPITHSKKEFCGYHKDGSTVKHGFEWIYSKQGTVEKKIYWEHGKESQYTELPKMDSNKDSLEAIAAIKSLLAILVIHGVRSSDGTFQVNKCDKNRMAWIKGAMMKSPISKNYNFEEGCDVSGNFTAKFGEEFPVEFKLRNLKDFDHSKMTIKMELIPQGRTVMYKFKTTDGRLSSPKTSAEFTGEFKVEIDPMTRKVNYNSQHGKIHVSKVNDQTVDIGQPLEFSM